jgi:predicted transposase/invertase (TIGR01784 family)
MHRPIDPKVDCVFKTLFGSDDHRDLLIHFLNALLVEDLAAPITAVDILNPYNERETLDDKLTVVDVKARDAAQRMFQIEIQLLVFADLAPRILYTWADLFSQQLQRGGDYRTLQPVYAIWILDATLLRDRPEYAHRYRLRDDRGRALLDHGSIRLFELSKFNVETVQSDAERWLKFLKDGETLDPQHLPVWMQPPIMRSAMSTLNAFSEKERDYHRYQSRQEALRVQRAVAYELEDRRAAEQAALQAAKDALQTAEAERQAKEAALQAKEAERQAKEAALQAKEAALQGRASRTSGPRRDRPAQGRCWTSRRSADAARRRPRPRSDRRSRAAGAPAGCFAARERSTQA